MASRFSLLRLVNLRRGTRSQIFLLGFATAGTVLGAVLPERSFDVPSGEATTTLRVFATQSAEQIVYMIHNVRGEITNAVSGKLPARAALERMLEGTNLVASHDPSNGALVVGRKRVRSRLDPNVQRAITTRSAGRGGQAKSSREDVDDTIVALSPFEVRADEDRGYRATSTVAGTRLRSELKDLAASISVVTRDFIQDVNATDLTTLLVYTLGM